MNRAAIRCTGRRDVRRAHAGFTIIETAIALVIFSIFGYVLAMTTAAGRRSQAEVQRVAAEDRDLREATGQLASELRSSRDVSIVTTALPDANIDVRFMVPITDAGAAAWGVYDPRLGPTAAAQNRAGWWLQYTLVDAPRDDGSIDKQLVRRILDSALAVQRTDVLAHDVKSGAGPSPGFRVVKNGAVWEITLSTECVRSGGTGDRTVLHVKTRN